jgi:hypothetical protein
MKLTGSKALKKAAGSKGPNPIPAKTEDDEDVGFFKTTTTWDLVPNKSLVLVYLLWYFNNTGRCKLHKNFSSVATEVHKVLQNNNLVHSSLDDDEDEPDTERWSITEKGCVLVRHILDLPLPEQVTTWSMPGKES